MGAIVVAAQVRVGHSPCQLLYYFSTVTRESVFRRAVFRRGVATPMSLLYEERVPTFLACATPLTSTYMLPYLLPTSL